MVFLIILLIILAIVGIALFASVSLKIYLNKNGFIVIKYLFFNFKYDIYGDNKLKKVSAKKHSKAKKADAEQKPDEGYIKKLYKKRGVVDGTVELLGIIKNILSKVLKLLSRASMTQFNLKIVVTSNDPATTAISYGAVSAVVYPAIGVINGIMPVEKQNVNIVADYEAGEPTVDFAAVIKVRVYKIVAIVFSLIKEFI